VKKTLIEVTKLRSEKELRGDVGRLKDLIKETVEDMWDSVNEGDYSLDYYVQRLNDFHNQLMTLTFILNDEGYD
jgi:hypothetical protein